MANIKISELNELEQVDNDDLLVIVDTSANETKKVKAQNVGTGGGGSDVVIIDDEQPTSEYNKIWIDTGEVQSFGSEVHIDTEIDNRVGLNILLSKNLFDKNNTNVLNAYFTAGTTTISQDSNSRVVYLKCNANTTYTISKVVSSRFAVGYSTTTPAIGVSLSGVIQNNTASSITITTGNNAQYICIFLRISSDTLTLDQILDTLQVEIGSTATLYENFNSTRINVYGNDIYNEGLSTYSTNEQRIGTWIDGKPLYRRIVQMTLPNATTDGSAVSTTTTVGSEPLDFKRIVCATAIASSSTLFLPFLNAAHHLVKAYFTGNRTLTLSNEVVGYNGSTVYIEVEYTKTTD